MDYFSSLNASALDPDSPTLFELISAHELSDLIGPSLRYILTHYAQRHPRYLLRLATRFDEIYAAATAAVEYHHLKNWNSTFTEKFYGVKRVRVLPSAGQLPRARHAAPIMVDNMRRLSHTQVLLSVAAAVLGPYLREKMDAKYESLKARALVSNMDTEYVRTMGDENLTRTKKFLFLRDYVFYKVYPVLTATRSAITLLFYLSYMFNRTSSAHSLLDWLLGFKYSRINANDYDLADKRAGVPPPGLSSGPSAPSDDDDDGTPFLGRIINFITTQAGRRQIRGAALSGLSYALPTAMFLLKFLEWWSASDFAHKLAATGGRRGMLEGNLPTPLPSSPEESKEEPDSDEEKEEILEKTAVNLPRETYSKIVRDSKLCPLCAEPVTNATAIETGVVFCYPCIYKHLESASPEEGGRCPVTGTRLLQCRYNADRETWDIGGLRRLMI